MSRESPGLMVHREEDPGDSSTERTRRPAGSGETAPRPFLSRECRPSAVCEGLLRPGKGPPEEVGRQHSAHERSRTVPAPTSLRPGRSWTVPGPTSWRPGRSWTMPGPTSLETWEVMDNARSH